MHYPAVFLPHQVDGQTVYDVTFPDVPGCCSQGGSLEEALENAAEALLCHLEDESEWPAASSLTVGREKGRTESEALGTPWPAGVEVLLVPAPARKAAKPEPVRLSISLKPALVEQVDAAALEFGLTRSGVIALATREYIKRLDI
jgi:predicted RNase H-like HicB family nuclease